MQNLADRIRPVALATEQLVPVLPAFEPLLPYAGLQRGTVVATAGSAGATSLALALLAAPSQAGSWVAAVGMPALGGVAAADMGIDLSRFALVPEPSTQQWPTIVAALLDAMDVVLMRAPAHLRSADARRLVARARESGAVIVTTGGGRWPEAPSLTLTAKNSEWHGLGNGWGHLQSRQVDVVATGRGPFARERHASLLLPGTNGLESFTDGIRQQTTPGSIDAVAG